jgi:hypothetical protein
MNTRVKNWNDLPDLMQAHELTKKDEQCLEDIRLVIEKYKLTSKFGISLLHKHFDIEEDEVLLERNDPITRELTLSPLKVTESMNLNYATTQWRFDSGALYGCCFCAKNHCDTSDQKQL